MVASADWRTRNVEDVGGGIANQDSNRTRWSRACSVRGARCCRMARRACRRAGGGTDGDAEVLNYFMSQKRVVLGVATSVSARSHWPLREDRADIDGLAGVMRHTTADAPKVLASAPAQSGCAAARIKRAAHSGSLSSPPPLAAPEPGTLHRSYRGPQGARALHRRSRGKWLQTAPQEPKSSPRTAIVTASLVRLRQFAIDEYTRRVFIEFIKVKSEAADAFKRIKASFDATVARWHPTIGQ